MAPGARQYLSYLLKKVHIFHINYNLYSSRQNQYYWCTVLKGGFTLRNKGKDFPNRISFDGEPRAKEEYSSKRADGTNRDHPQERMMNSNQNRK
jgi:small acid-soluble spore protein K (minor)